MEDKDKQRGDPTPASGFPPKGTGRVNIGKVNLTNKNC